MGCTSSTRATIKSRFSTIDKSNFKKRDGHPTYYKEDGYDFGIRVRVKTTFQSTFVGTSRLNNEKVTIKEHHLAYSEEADVAYEVSIISRLAHEGIPKFREAFITNNSIFVVTDYVDSIKLSIYLDRSAKTCSLQHEDVRKIMKLLLNALQYCHDRRIIMRNIMPNNIMVRKSNKDDYDVKIHDFSFAVEEGSSKVLADHPLFDWKDVSYTAPEALLGNAYSCSMDIWSFGVMLFELLSGKLPFDCDDDKQLIEKIKYASFIYDASNTAVWKSMGDNAKYLIGQLLVSNASDRLSCKEILTSNWFYSGSGGTERLS